MKNLKTYNPIVLARNAIAATGLMTILNIIVVAMHFTPIFPLSLNLPITASYYLFNAPQELIDIFGSMEALAAARPFFMAIALLVMIPLIYSYFRSAKKPKAIKIGFGVIILDTVFLLLNFIVDITWFIDAAYHAYILWYIFKGIKALKETSRV